MNLQWNSVNIPTHDFYKKPDYFIALRRIPSTKYVLIVGMMFAADVKTLCTDARGQWKPQYYRSDYLNRKTGKREPLKSPFLSIPEQEFEKGERSISARRVIAALSDSKRAVAELSETNHINP